MLTEIELRNVMRRAFTLGETHWRLADSERTSDHRRADDTRRQFEALVDGVVGLMAERAAPGVPVVDASGEADPMGQVAQHMRDHVDGITVKQSLQAAAVALSLRVVPDGVMASDGGQR